MKRGVVGGWFLRTYVITMQITDQERSLLAGLEMAGGRFTYKRAFVAAPDFDRELVPLLLSLDSRLLVRILSQASLEGQPGGDGGRGRYLEITAELTDAGREALR